LASDNTNVENSQKQGSQDLTSFGQEAFFNEKVTFYKGIEVLGDSLVGGGGGEVAVEKDGINITPGVRTLNFTGNAVSSVTLSEATKSTVTLEISSNLDGGKPDSVYGGIAAVNGGDI
jgi:hypothetical protein